MINGIPFLIKVDVVVEEEGVSEASLPLGREDEYAGLSVSKL